MARNLTLGELMTDLRSEVGDSTDPATGQTVRDHYRRILNRTYEWLHDDFSWPFLQAWVEKPMEKGKYLYDFPSEIDISRVEKVWTRWSSQWFRMENSLSPINYNEFDTGLNERYSPQFLWFPRSDTQFEVWPIPASDDDKLLFVGYKKFFRLVADADRAVIDGNLIVLFAAAELLERRNQKDAKAKLSQAQRYYRRLRGRLSSRKVHSFFQPSRDGRYPLGPIPPDYSQGQ